MKLGARIFKTGLAVVLALMLGELFHLPSPVFAAISAVFAIQPSIYRSYLTILEQVQGNVIGAIIAIVFVLLFGNHYIIVGLAAIILIIINLKLKIDTVSLSVVTLIVIMETPQDDFITFAILRFATIMLGILSAFIINLIFLPPKYETKLYTSISDITNDILKWTRITNHDAVDHTLIKKDLELLKEQFIHVEQVYLLYKEERTFLKKHKLGKIRKVVIYRQMITTAKRALEILRKLHYYPYDIYQLPTNIREQLMNIIVHLNNNHEHLLLRYIGKAVQVHKEEMEEYVEKRNELLHLFDDMQKISSEQLKMDHMLQFMASILDYNEQLEKLEILISSLHQYHREEIDVDGS